MQVFFAWVAAQKLSSCKQRIITSCTSGLHNKRYGSTNYDARSASRGNLNASFTLDTYTHVTSDMQKQACGIVGGFMEDIFGKELKPWQESEKPATEP